MRSKLRFLLAMLAVGTVLTGPLAASTKHGSTPKEIAGAGNPLSGWPTWSGPHSDLTAAGDGIFDRPGFGLEVLWSKPLGSGYSGIVVAGERVVTAFSDGESDLVTALDAATGDERWRYRIAETYKGHDNSDDGPLATPTIHDGLVYGLGARGRLFALRLADGKQVWSRDLVEELGARKPRYGFVSAPTIVGGVLVIQTGGPEGQSITVLDPKTGKLLWSAGDDAVDYQSPMALRVDGEAQIFALTNRHLMGLMPETGALLWKHEHASEDSFYRTQPVPVGEAGVLLTDRSGSVLFRVEKAADGYRVEKAWRNSALKTSLAVPVPYQGHIYGYSSRSFLTCVDAETGEPVWKSRSPGGGDLVLVDGHLVMMAPNGEVVVAEATPEGYREKARVPTLERGSLTRPSFAGGRVYVRNLTDIAAVGVSDEMPAATPATAAAADTDVPDSELRGKLGELVRKVRATDDKQQLIDEFLAAHREYPILEGEDLVHFVFRGEVEELMLVGNMAAWEREQPMYRIAGTDLYFRSLSLEPGARFEYAFAVFDDTRLDPLNPRHSAIAGRERSVVTTRDWSEPAHLREPEGARGRIEKLTWRSEILGDEREVQVYLPPGYDDGVERYPLLMFQWGDDALTWGLMDRALDNLVGRSVAPLVAVFVPRGDSPELTSNVSAYTQALAEELIPLLDRSYRTIARPEARGLMGTTFAGWGSFLVVLERPGVFTKVAAQSPSWDNTNHHVLLERIESRDQVDLDMVLEWTDHEATDRQGRTPGRELAEALEQKGYRPVTRTAPGGSGWGSWREGIDRVLETLFPLVETVPARQCSLRSSRSWTLSSCGTVETWNV